MKLPNRKEFEELINYPDKLFKKVNKLKIDKKTKSEIKHLLNQMYMACQCIEQTYVAFDMYYYGRPLMNPYLIKDIVEEFSKDRDYPLNKETKGEA